MTRFRRIVFLFLVMAFTSAGLLSQDDAHFELQIYPTGIIPGIRLEKNFAKKNAAHIRVGFQLINHWGLGVQEEEKGYGYGTSFGYKRYFKEEFKGFSLGAKCDLWQNFISWKNDAGTAMETSGKTEIYVVQPTLELSYTFLKNKDLLIVPNAAFGFEWNVKTEGLATGEGPIFLIGILIGKRNFST